MKLTIEIDDQILVKGAGTESLVNVADYSADAWEYILRYGFNRAHQDRANSAAKKERDETGDADGDAILAKVIETLQAGKVNVRGEGTGRTDVEQAMISLARAQAKASDEKRYKNFDTAAEKDAFVWAYIEGLPEAQIETYRAMAEIEVEEKAETAKRKAAMKAKLAAKLAEAK